jgi:hypothetical protein
VNSPAAPKRLRIGVIFPGRPDDPKTWSGTPSGVLRGLDAAGAEAVSLSAALPRRLERAAGGAVGLRHLPRSKPAESRSALQNAYAAAQAGPAMARLHSAVGTTAVRRAGRLDGLIQIGTGFSIRTGVPTASFEDMTIKQALQYPYADWRALPQRAIDARVELQTRVYARVAACCMTSSWAAASAIEDYGVPRERVHVVGVGSNQPLREVERDWTRPRFLFVGKEWERKNGPLVVEAFRRLRATVPDAELNLVGGHPPLDEPGVVGHGLLRLDVTEHRERMRALYDGATCFVMPSLLEPSAIVYAEAASAGLPSIGTSVGGSGDIIGDGGILVDPASPDETYEAMLQIADPAVAARVGAVAAERGRILTWEAVGQRLLRSLGLNTRPVEYLAGD